MGGSGMASTFGEAAFRLASQHLCRAVWPSGRNGGKLLKRGWKALKATFAVNGSLWTGAGNATLGTCRFELDFGAVPACSWPPKTTAPELNTCAVVSGRHASPQDWSSLS